MRNQKRSHVLSGAGSQSLSNNDTADRSPKSSKTNYAANFFKALKAIPDAYNRAISQKRATESNSDFFQGRDAESLRYAHRVVERHFTPPSPSNRSESGSSSDENQSASTSSISISLGS